MQDTKGFVLHVSMFISLLFWAGAFFIPEQIISFYTDIPELKPYGVDYLRALSFSFLITGATRLYFCYMRVMGEAKSCLLYSTYACILNVICNSIFIFGLFGVPRLGVYGAALSTTISGLLQLVLVVWHTQKDRSRHISWTFTNYKSPVPKNFLVTVFPISVHCIIFCVANNLIAGAFGRMNADILAASSLLTIISMFILCINEGVALGGAVLIGGLLGRNNPEKTWQSSKVFIKFVTRNSLMFVPLVLILGFASTFLPLEMSDAAIQYVYILTIFFAINIFFACMNLTLEIGVLFTGNDAKSVPLITAIILWGILVPMAFIGTYWASIPIVLFFIILKSDYILAFPYKIYRFYSKKWMRTDAIS